MIARCGRGEEERGRVSPRLAKKLLLPAFDLGPKEDGGPKVLRKQNRLLSEESGGFCFEPFLKNGDP